MKNIGVGKKGLKSNEKAVYQKRDNMTRGCPGLTI